MCWDAAHCSRIGGSCSAQHGSCRQTKQQPSPVHAVHIELHPSSPFISSSPSMIYKETPSCKIQVARSLYGMSVRHIRFRASLRLCISCVKHQIFVREFEYRT